jgi:type I restriction enzyme S subunit
VTEGEWRSERLKNIADVAFSSVDKKSVEGEIAVRLCNYTDVYYNGEITADLPFMDATASLDQLRSFGLRAGDVLITKDSETADDIGVPAFVPQTLDGVVSGYHLAVLRPKRELVDPKYLFWSISSTPAREQMSVLASGVTRYGLRFGDVGNLRFLLPDLDNQRALAVFLDRETARIDALISAKERLRSALAVRWEVEARLSVTGQDASPWPVAPLKRHWTVIDCNHRTPAYVVGGYPIVSPGDIDNGRVHLGRTNRFIDEAAFVDLTLGRRPRLGDVIYTRNAAIGKAGYVETDEPFAMGQDVCLITSSNQDQRFLAYFLNTAAADQLETLKLGATFNRINVSQILELRVPCPSQEVQSLVAGGLDRRRAIYADMDDRLAVQIERLAEHRLAVITAAVAGEIDFRTPAD